MQIKKEHISIFAVYILIIITFFSFYPAVNNGLTNWDDNYYVLENESVKSLSFQNLKKIFTSTYLANYQPVTILSYLVEWQIFGSEPMGYHLTNIMLHIFNTLIVLWFIYLLCGKIEIAFLTSLIFGIHPLHAESVVWIAERKGLLATFFLLLSIVSFLYYEKEKKLRFIYLSVFLFIFSLLSKSSGLTLPLILHLTDFLKKKKLSRENLLQKLPFWIISVLFFVITFLTQKNAGALKFLKELSVFDNFLVACHGIIFYLFKTIYPLNLSSMYPYPPKTSGGWLPVVFIISPMIVFGLVILIFLSLKYTRKILFGSLFYLIVLLPVLQLIPVGGAIAADRYTYIPLIGIFYLFSEGVFYIYYKKIIAIKSLKVRKGIQIFFYTVIASVFILLSVLTYNRSKIWKNSMTLWNDVIKKYPYVAGAYNNRGLAYMEMKEYNKAIKDFSINLELKPDSPKTYYNRGNAYFNIGDYDRAIDDYSEALKLDNNFTEVYYNRGSAYFRKMMIDNAIEDYSQTLKANPVHVYALKNRGAAYAYLGLYENALEDLDAALKINPSFIQAILERIELYIKMKQTEKAEEDINFLHSINYEIPERLLKKIKENN